MVTAEDLQLQQGLLVVDKSQYYVAKHSQSPLPPCLATCLVDGVLHLSVCHHDGLQTLQWIVPHAGIVDGFNFRVFMAVFPSLPRQLLPILSLRENVFRAN